ERERGAQLVAHRQTRLDDGRFVHEADRELITLYRGNAIAGDDVELDANPGDEMQVTAEQAHVRLRIRSQAEKHRLPLVEFDRVERQLTEDVDVAFARG